mmetsp:Transcript_18795/g.42957  ORF Transcript_18795/g.42957 Transcript_18795/m.42957 type:complete len:117 (+) Transcript_18795:68-418(+)
MSPWCQYVVLVHLCRRRLVQLFCVCFTPLPILQLADEKKNPTRLTGLWKNPNEERSELMLQTIGSAPGSVRTVASDKSFIVCLERLQSSGINELRVLLIIVTCFGLVQFADDSFEN